MLGRLEGNPRKPWSAGEAGKVRRREQTTRVTPERHPGVSGTSDELQSPEKSVTGLYVCVQIGGVRPWTLDKDAGGFGCLRAIAKPWRGYKC